MVAKLIAPARPSSLFNACILSGVMIIAAIAIFAPFFAPASAYDSDILSSLLPPSPEHWFGTDEQGRDVFWRVLLGARVSLGSAFAIVVAYSMIGMVVATMAALGPRWLDTVLMRLTDIGLALPGMIVALGFAAAMGPSLSSAIISMTITGWPISARLLRGILRQTMASPFVQGAIVLGVSPGQLATRHILPNSLDVLIIKWAGDISNTILLLGSLSFIGVGAQPPSPEWGAMVSDARNSIATAWWTAAAPGLAIALTSVVFGLFGEFLQAWRNPAMQND